MPFLEGRVGRDAAVSQPGVRADPVPARIDPDAGRNDVPFHDGWNLPALRESHSGREWARRLYRRHRPRSAVSSRRTHR
jgi:hypothetical protein